MAEGGLSTPESPIRELDRLRRARICAAVGGYVRLRSSPALRQRDPAVLAPRRSCNDLEAGSAVDLPRPPPRALDAGAAAGALAGMVSGSGPTCVFLARDPPPKATSVAAAIADRGLCRAVRTAHGPVPGARLV